MRTSIATLVATLALLAAPSAHAGVDAKIQSKLVSAQNAKNLWKGTKTALKQLGKRVQLRAALGASSEHIVLGERTGSYAYGATYYSRALHFGLTDFSAYAPVKVEWKEQLVFGKNGLEVHRHESVSTPTKESIKAMSAELDAQFAKKPDFVRMPETPVEHTPFGPMRLVARDKVGVKFFSRDLKLDAAKWAHVTPEVIDSQIAAWGNQ